MNATTLSTALHERVGDEHPDLDHLVRAATASGARIRRRRRIAATTGGATAVAAVAVGVALLGGSGSPHGATRHEPGFASDPTSAPTVPPGSGQVSTREDQLRRLSREAQARAKALQVLQTAPVYVDSADWRCDQPLDEKFICSHGASSVVVVWRPAEYWQDYQDPAKAGPETFVSDVHGRFFATVDAGLDTTHAQVVEVGEALVWAE